MKIEAFPLCWPPGYPVRDEQVASNFKCSMPEARDGVLNEIKLLAGYEAMQEAIISTNIKPGKNGGMSGPMIYSYPGVAVYFTFQGEQRVIACDKWQYVHENLQAIMYTIKGIRAMDRHGATDIISRAMGNMKALPQQAGATAGHNWWQILLVEQTATPEETKKAYRRLSAYFHPDKSTGNRDMLDLVQKAYRESGVK